MPRLAEIQRRLREAVVAGDPAGILPMLVGGRDPIKRLAIHQRNYETSLVNALLGKFPATDWLVGPGFLTQTAREFIRIRPPSVPCIAEYGADFPGFLQTRPLAGRVPYMRSLAELEWCLGHVAIAADRPALSPDDVSAVDPDALCNARFAIQDGIRYLAVSWPVDELMKLYLAEKAPDQFHMSPGDLWLEVRGSRGAFQINRLENGEFEFRKAIKEGRTVGASAELAFEADADFDAGRCFMNLLTDGLATAIKSGGID